MRKTPPKTLKRLLVMLLGTALLAASLAVQAGETVTYVQTDIQGNPVTKTDSSGKVIWRQSYAPYGRTYQQTDPDGPGYTGHRHDAATGLVYMQARYYDPKIGRFLSPDPVTFSPEQPDHFNLYWYAKGNPYKYTDPTGMYNCGDAGGAACKAATKLVKGLENVQKHYNQGSETFNKLNKMLGFLGKQNDGNKVNIMLTTVGKDNGGALMDKKGNYYLNLNVKLSNQNSKIGRATFIATGAHETQHLMDDKQLGRMPATYMEEFHSEVNAIHAETPVWNALQQADPWGTWTPNGGYNAWNAGKEASYEADAYCKTGC